MEQSFYHRLASALWGVIVLLLVLLAVYVSVGRMLVSSIDRYSEGILQELNIRAPFDIEAESVSGIWRAFSPIIVLTDLSITLPESPESPLHLTQGRVGVDVWKTLLTQSLHVTHLRLDGLRLLGEFSSKGAFRLKGFAEGSGSSGEWIQTFLLSTRSIALNNNTLLLTLPSGEVRELDLDLVLTRRGSSRRVEALLSSTRGAVISILAQGLGNPFNPDAFSGDLYVDVKSSDLGAVRDLFAGGAPGLWAEGALEVELWMSWDEGAPTVEGRVAARDLVVAPRSGDWQVPLNALSFQGQLSRQRDSWTIFADDVRAASGPAQLHLPRLQLDAWGTALRLRAADVQLGQLTDLALEQKAIPEGFRSLLATLDPAADIAALQVSIGDPEDIAQQWEVEARFDDLSVQPWRGAPGVTSAGGYVQLSPGNGSLLIDTRQMELAFPGLYRQPLYFDELHGSLFLDWNAEQVVLSSGLLKARGEEGDVRALFGLDIPLQPDDIGIEMSLLAGLANTSTEYRSKYVPYSLPETLGNWLRESIGEGEIAAGGFLWRGALQSGGEALRTIQLGLNVRDTELTYHPDWPPVTMQEGIVLVDDAEVSVWAERARLYDSTVSDLSVETGLDTSRRLTLAIDGDLVGPASDGLFVLNNTPLTEVVGEVFTGWDLEGELAAELALDLVLGDNAPAPAVDVRTRLQNVDLRIAPGNIAVTSVAGNFNYSSQRGFSSEGLTGVLWGEPVQVALRQHHAAPNGRYAAASSALEIVAQGNVDMVAMQDWLDLQVLQLARGKTPVDLSIHVRPGDAVELIARSSLQGVSLDLPPPWAKPAEISRDFVLRMGLGESPQPLAITLAEALALDLDLRDGSLYSGALGVAAAAPAAEPGTFRISGEAPLLQVEAMSDFVQRYLLGIGDDLVATNEEATEAIQSDVDENAASAGADALGLMLVVEELKVAELQYAGQTVLDLVLNGSLANGQVEAAAETDWLRAAVLWPLEQERIQVEVEHLDLSGLPGLSFTQDEPVPTEAPTAETSDKQAAVNETRLLVDLALLNIFQGEDRLGELSFTLRLTDEALLASRLRGELAAIRLEAEETNQLLVQFGEEPRTSLNVRLGFDDLGATLSHFDYAKIIQTRRGSFDVDLQWPGAPMEFALASGEGAVLIDVGAGSFLDVPAGAAGAVRVVNILNLVHIVQSLSVSHMFDSGIPFDKVNGEIYLHSGTIEVPRMEIKGGSSFRFSGASDIASETLNGELVATLPVGKNLPWVAALAAGLPVAAGVFVVSKIFDRQVDRLSSAVYRLDGTWDEPSISFDRIFDTAADIPAQSRRTWQPGENGEPKADKVFDEVTLPEAQAGESATPSPEPPLATAVQSPAPGDGEAESAGAQVQPSQP
ncbi:MAG: YhdP family protein [Halioglobus sp.]